MWKLILKNLWARRRRNGWLLAELDIGEHHQLGDTGSGDCGDTRS